MTRRWHPNKDIEKILRRAERLGWRVESPPKGYFRMRCPCEEKHMRWVHLTPSDPRYARNLLKWVATLLLLEGGPQMMFSATIEAELHRANGAPFESLLDELMQHLIAKDALDPAIGATGATETIEVTTTVVADSFEEAVALGMSLVRGALSQIVDNADRVEWRAASATRLEPTPA